MRWFLGSLVEGLNKTRKIMRWFLCSLVERLTSYLTSRSNKAKYPTIPPHPAMKHPKPNRTKIVTSATTSPMAENQNNRC